MSQSLQGTAQVGTRVVECKKETGEQRRYLISRAAKLCIPPVTVHTKCLPRYLGTYLGTYL